MQEKRFKVGDTVTYKDYYTLPNKKYRHGGSNQAGYKGIIKRYVNYSDDYGWTIGVTTNSSSYDMLESEFEEWDNPTTTTKTNFSKGDYIVVMQEVISSNFKQHHVFKQSNPFEYLSVVKDCSGKANGHYGILFNKPEMWRYATPSEVLQYDVAGKPIDVASVLSEIPGTTVSIQAPKAINWKEFKINVRSESESREAQELMLKLGIGWYKAKGEIQYLQYTYLYVEKNELGHGSTPSFFTNDPRNEVTLEQLRFHVGSLPIAPFTPEQAYPPLWKDGLTGTIAPTKQTGLDHQSPIILKKTINKKILTII
jgi:hypothetical protein